MKTQKLSPQERSTALQQLDGWADVADRDAIHKSYTFKNFSQAFGFMARVAMRAEKMDHHPEWSNIYNTVHVTLTTHSVQGLSELDITLATYMDRIKPFGLDTSGGKLWVENPVKAYMEKTMNGSDEHMVRSDLVNKIKRTIGRVPFAEQALAAYFCVKDPRTPARVKAILAGALAYFIMPVDLAPDFIAGLGFTDDATVFWLAWNSVKNHISHAHIDNARHKLAQLGNEDTA